MKITIIYPQGHTNTSEWLKSAWYCIHCGKQEVWIEQGEGDYYEGPQHICSACGSFFAVPNFRDAIDTELQVLEQIRK